MEIEQMKQICLIWTPCNNIKDLITITLPAALQNEFAALVGHQNKNFSAQYLDNNSDLASNANCLHGFLHKGT